MSICAVCKQYFAYFTISVRSATWSHVANVKQVHQAILPFLQASLCGCCEGAHVFGMHCCKYGISRHGVPLSVLHNCCLDGTILECQLCILPSSMPIITNKSNSRVQTVEVSDLVFTSHIAYTLRIVPESELPAI